MMKVRTIIVILTLASSSFESFSQQQVNALIKLRKWIVYIFQLKMNATRRGTHSICLNILTSSMTKVGLPGQKMTR
jgi:hypothetical protein